MWFCSQRLMLVYNVCSQNQQEVQITESEQVWRSLIDEGEDVVPLSSVDSSISNLEVFCYARLAFILLAADAVLN